MHRIRGVDVCIWERIEQGVQNLQDKIDRCAPQSIEREISLLTTYWSDSTSSS